MQSAVSTDHVAATSAYRLARINGTSGNLTWEAKYPSNVLNGIPLLVVPRATQGDFLTFYPALSRSLPGEACTAIDHDSWASVSCSGSSYAIGALPGVDGISVWIWGAPGIDGAASLNPLATSQWSFTSNSHRFGGEDAFILGIRGEATSVGPWMTEGDYGPGLLLAVLPDGDLAVTVQGNDYMTFNGGQTLLEQSGSVLFRLDPATGHIVWRTALSQPPSALIAAPGGRIAVLSTVPSVQLFDGATGALLSTLPLPPTSSHPVLAAGQADLFVLGDYSSAFDFDPGPGSDQPPSNHGVYISRYAF
jgi:hypothetical protein